ncbi:MAG: 50S ribosomal protein L2 [bacterium]
MGLKRYKPTTSGLRYSVLLSNEDITKQRPDKSLTVTKKRRGGRNADGKVSVRHRGGGHKRRLRLVDIWRDKVDIEGRVTAIEYDPNRSARIALVCYADGEKRYIIAPKGLAVGDHVSSGDNAEISEGCALRLRDIPTGALIHNIEMRPGSGGKVARAAGIFAQILAKEGKYCHVRLPSGEVHLFHQECRATIGQVGNEEHGVTSYGKAGRKRWLGIKPTVRGTAMNPCDHPHGGGEGKNKSAGRHPVSPWGVPAKGGKTRDPHKSNKWIVMKRKKK